MYLRDSKKYYHLNTVISTTGIGARVNSKTQHNRGQHHKYTTTTKTTMFATLQTTDHVLDFKTMTRTERRKAMSKIPSVNLDPGDIFQEGCRRHDEEDFQVPRHRTTIKLEKNEYDGSTKKTCTADKKRKIVSQQTNSTQTSSTSISSRTASVPQTIQVQETIGGGQYHPTTHHSSSLPGLASTVDMSLTEFNDESMVTVLRRDIKIHVFPLWKFFQPEYQGGFSRDEHTICGFLMKKSGFHGGSEAWWSAAQTLVTKTLTDCRNNCIKNIQMKFKGKYTALTLLHLIIENTNINHT